MSREHKLHKLIGDIIKDFCLVNSSNKLIPVLDEACGGREQISLFIGDKGAETRMCKVDALIIRNDKVKCIIEIEESNIKPTQIFGKLFTSEFSDNYINRNNNIFTIGNDVLFIQILDEIKLKYGSKKTSQFNKINESIQQRIGSFRHIRNYRIISGKYDDFKPSEKSYELLLNNLKGLNTNI